MNQDKNSEKDLPGYPHYPAKDDITNNESKVSLDKDKTTAANADATTGDSDINAEDLAALEQEDRNIVASRLDNTDNEGAPLNEQANNTDMGADLDVPGAELDDANEAIGEEDEENNYYSQGDNDTTEDTEGIP